ncbi:MAG: hypothetical protein JST54_15460 [Deltaproteobacteria bacterium]|nr:hypothetical protein [Deltaproteobacteria bacterium]
MNEATRTALSGWSGFYVILGSASGALIGLMFVAVTLVASMRRDPNSRGSLAAFGTPTIVQLVAPLVLAALLSTPWPRLDELAILLEVLGLAGVIYASRGTWLARIQTSHQTELSDWIWFHVAPLAGYAALPVAAFELRKHLETGLFVIAAVTLALMLVAIRNAWDTATYVAVWRDQA